LDDGLVLVDSCSGDFGMDIIAYVNVAADMVEGVAVSAKRTINMLLSWVLLNLGNCGSIRHLRKVITDGEVVLFNLVVVMAGSLKNGCIVVVHGRVHVRGVNLHLGEHSIAEDIEVMIIEVGASDRIRVKSVGTTVVTMVCRGMIIDMRARIISGRALRCEWIIVHMQISGNAV
jgi:hypothetical protein